MSNTFVNELHELINQQWQVVRTGQFWSHIASQGWNPDLYTRVMEQIFHYTRHNSMNQAAAAFRTDPDNTGLLRFIYEHAREELGHEKMASHDLDTKGWLNPAHLSAPPLPATRALIGYLYYVSFHYGGIARLGYSFWAESSYDKFDDVLQRARQDLDLDDKNMTFFVAHSRIDQKHAQEVEEAIEKFVSTDEQRAQVKEVAETTLYMTGMVLENALQDHLAATRS